MKIENKFVDFKYKNLNLAKIRELVLEDQMKIAVDLRNKNFISAQNKIYSFLRSENSRILAVYETVSRKHCYLRRVFGDKPFLQKDFETMISKLWLFIKKPKLYKATPILVSKSERSLLVASYLDCALQFLYKMVLDVVYEETSDPNSFCFRQFRTPRLGYCSNN